MYLGTSTDSRVQKRRAVEKRIVMSAINELLGHGFYLSVFDGEEHSKPTRDKQAIVDAIMNTDEDYLNVYQPMPTITNQQGIMHLGWIRFVYGNCGWDVLADNTLNIEQFDECVGAGLNAGAKCEKCTGSGRLPGIFRVWQPRRIEKIMPESSRGSEEVRQLMEQGITPVFVPDDDRDHQGSVYDHEVDIQQAVA